MNKPVFYIILFLVFSFSLEAQENLVPNGSFEEYSECPSSNELNNGQFERAISWFRPTFGTPDYFHRCNYDINIFNTVGVPENFRGYQNAYQGDAYLGFVAMEWNNDGSSNAAEYMRTKLKSPLIPCAIYHYRMYVSLADVSTHGIGKIGAWFSVDNVTFPDEVPIIVEPHVAFQGDPIVDTSNWTLVEGTFVAEGFEEYLTIGYFHDNVQNDTTFVQDNQFYNASYYYVDSVSLIEIGAVSENLCDLGEIVFPNVITPNNDNNNDYVDASSYFIITDEIAIMNRWGNLIAVLTQDSPVWDGTNQQGVRCAEGSYFYSFSYKWGAQTKSKNGFIQLVR